MTPAQILDAARNVCIGIALTGTLALMLWHTGIAADRAISATLGGW